MRRSSLDIIVVMPYGNSNGLLHVKFEGDHKTFCGRDCEGWLQSDKDPVTAVRSAYICKRCYGAYFK